MKDEMMHIAKKDKKKLWLLGALALISVFLLIFGNALSEEPTAASGESTVSSGSEELPDAEEELERLLSSMDGVGKVDVIISYEGEIRQLYAYNEERSQSEKEDGSSEVTEKKEMVLLDGDGAPVVTERIYPPIGGVVVVAEGASSDKVREQLLNAVSSYLHIGKNRIEIAAMEGAQ